MAKQREWTGEVAEAKLHPPGVTDKDLASAGAMLTHYLSGQFPGTSA
jgi:hypothetical protein